MEKYILREYYDDKIIDEIIFQNYPIAKTVYDYLVRNGKDASLIKVR
jgi:hypothetical protein